MCFRKRKLSFWRVVCCQPAEFWCFIDAEIENMQPFSVLGVTVTPNCYQVQCHDRETVQHANANWCCEGALTFWASLAAVLDPTLYNLKIAWFDLVGKPKNCKTAQNHFKPEFPPSNQTSLVSPAPVLFPVSPWDGGVSASQRPLLLAVLILFSGREVCPLSDLPFFSSLLFHPPMGYVMLVDWLQLYHTLTSTQEMWLICWEHDWKLPRRSLNAVGLWRVLWIRVTRQGATVWTICATFFSSLPTNHTLGKSNLCCDFSSIVFFKVPQFCSHHFCPVMQSELVWVDAGGRPRGLCAVFLPGLICN